MLEGYLPRGIVELPGRDGDNCDIPSEEVAAREQVISGHYIRVECDLHGMASPSGGMGEVGAAQRPRDEPPGQLLDPILDPICRSWPGRLQRVVRQPVTLLLGFAVRL